MKNIVCLGDSTTYGYKIERKKVWVSILNDKLNKDDKDIVLKNKGINGDTTSGMLKRFDNDVINENADTLLFMGGVNDIFIFQSLNKIEDNLKNIINKSLENNINIIVFTPLPFVREIFTFFEDDNLEEYEKTLLEYVSFINEYTKENNIKCIDVYNIFNNALKNNDANEIYFDGVHLSELGHNILALELYNEIKNKKINI